MLALGGLLCGIPGLLFKNARRSEILPSLSTPTPDPNEHQRNRLDPKSTAAAADTWRTSFISRQDGPAEAHYSTSWKAKRQKQPIAAMVTTYAPIRDTRYAQESPKCPREAPVAKEAKKIVYTVEMYTV